MAKLEFTSNASPTIGVELELGIVHGETFQLESGCTRHPNPGRQEVVDVPEHGSAETLPCHV